MGRGSQVSILVFVELAPGPLGVEVLDGGACLFQSLFLWNSRPDAGLRAAVTDDLMFQSLFLWNSRPDIAVQAGAFAPRQCFNPCFCGTRARTEVTDGDLGASEGVSILVFVELAPGLHDVSGTSSPAELFQSLFLWNSRPDTTAGAWQVKVQVFQSLFLWNSRPDIGRHRTGPAYLRSFNPCFCGTRARTCVITYSDILTNTFQSLFLWNSRPDWGH